MERCLYNDYASYSRRIFGGRVQKISINAGFTCPNRDGFVGFNGCTYCNNQTFNPDYCQPNKSISQQIDEGIHFFSHKYQGQYYLAYFQAYTNTYAPLSILRKYYEEALSNPLVKGIVIGTRPDCINKELLDYLQQISLTKYVMVEFGVESTNDTTLRLINRGHNYEVARQAIIETAKRGIATSAHLILGLPCENNEQIINHANLISQLPLTTIKLHQLQLIKGTVMAQQYNEHPEWFHIFSVEEYIELLINFIAHLNPQFVIERFISQSPSKWLIAPQWGLKNYEFTDKLEKRMQQENIHQGDLLIKRNPRQENT